MFHLAIVNKVLCHCHSWLARQWSTVECKALKTCSVMSLNNVLTFYSYFVCYIKYILHKVIKDE